MSVAKLKNAPLKEVIFELHWGGTIENNLIDEGFDLAQGKFADMLKDTYPVRKRLIPENSPVKIFGVPLHQYWKGEFQWPVIQHGQGILAINEVESGYEWEKNFKPTALRTLEILQASYEEPIIFNRAKLQYIDAYEIVGIEPNKFMELNLLTSIQTKYPLPGIAKNFNIFQSFELKDGSELQLNIATGLNSQSQQPSLIWTTTVEKVNKFKDGEIVEWLENAHNATSNMFKQMLNPEFYASLDR